LFGEKALLFSDYKSAALPTELCRHFMRGNAAFSSNFRPHCIRDFLCDASWPHGALASCAGINIVLAIIEIPLRK
jgi:hypothetical protein